MTDDLRKYLQEIKKANDLIVIKKKVQQNMRLLILLKNLRAQKLFYLKISKEANSNWFQIW